MSNATPEQRLRLLQHTVTLADLDHGNSSDESSSESEAEDKWAVYNDRSRMQQAVASGAAQARAEAEEARRQAEAERSKPKGRSRMAQMLLRAAAQVRGDDKVQQYVRWRRWWHHVCVHCLLFL